MGVPRHPRCRGFLRNRRVGSVVRRRVAVELRPARGVAKGNETAGTAMAEAESGLGKDLAWRGRGVGQWRIRGVREGRRGA